MAQIELLDAIQLDMINRRRGSTSACANPFPRVPWQRRRVRDQAAQVEGIARGSSNCLRDSHEHDRTSPPWDARHQAPRCTLGQDGDGGGMADLCEQGVGPGAWGCSLWHPRRSRWCLPASSAILMGPDSAEELRPHRAVGSPGRARDCPRRHLYGEHGVGYGKINHSSSSTGPGVRLMRAIRV